MFHLPARARRGHLEPRHKCPKSPTERRAQPSSRKANPSGVAREPGGEGGFGHPEPGCNLGQVRKHAHLQPTGVKPIWATLTNTPKVSPSCASSSFVVSAAGWFAVMRSRCCDCDCGCDCGCECVINSYYNFIIVYLYIEGELSFTICYHFNCLLLYIPSILNNYKTFPKSW